MSTSTINVGIIGLGFMGAMHIKAYRKVPVARVAAICNPSGRRLNGDFSDVVGNVGDKEPVRLDMRDIKSTKCFEDLLGDPNIHVVDICAPTVAHESLAVAALDAGKHVLCEKPLARSVAAAQRIADAASRAKGFFMPAMCVRFWPETAWIAKAIKDQTYGKVLSAWFRRVAEPPAWGQQNFFNGAESGGGLFDLHIHDSDFVQFCFGRPKAVTSAGYKKFSSAFDHVVTRYDFAPDRDHPLADAGIVHAEGSWAMTPGFGFRMTATINFERATVDFDLGRGAEGLRLCEAGQKPRVIQCEGPDGYARQLDYFLQCIQSGRPPTVVTATDAVTSVEICEAEEKSASLRQTVTLS
jgi:predicted dehydrogenase